MFPKHEHRNQSRAQDAMENAEFQCPEVEVGGAAVSLIPQVPLGSQSDAEEEEEGMDLDFTRQEQSSMLGLLQ